MSELLLDQLKEDRDEALANLVTNRVIIHDLEVRQAAAVRLITDFVIRCWTENATDPRGSFDAHHNNLARELLPKIYRELTREKAVAR